MKALSRGFSLIELMATVAIIGILTAIALPSYQQYVTRSRLTDAFSGLAGVQAQAEQYWANERKYTGFNRLPPDTVNFRFVREEASTTTYLIRAIGINKAAGFEYTINQSGARTSVVPPGWTANPTCWVNNKSGQCLG